VSEQGLLLLGFHLPLPAYIVRAMEFSSARCMYSLSFLVAVTGPENTSVPASSVEKNPTLSPVRPHVSWVWRMHCSLEATLCKKACSCLKTDLQTCRLAEKYQSVKNGAHVRSARGTSFALTIRATITQTLCVQSSSC
jgi:hypothetical protein